MTAFGLRVLADLFAVRGHALKKWLFSALLSGQALQTIPLKNSHVLANAATMLRKSFIFVAAFARTWARIPKRRIFQENHKPPLALRQSSGTASGSGQLFRAADPEKQTLLIPVKKSESRSDPATLVNDLRCFSSWIASGSVPSTQTGKSKGVLQQNPLLKLAPCFEHRTNALSITRNTYADFTDSLLATRKYN